MWQNEEDQLSYVNDLLSLLIPLLSNPLSQFRTLAKSLLGKVVVCGTGIKAGVDTDMNEIERNRKTSCPLHKALVTVLMTTYVSTLESCSSSISGGMQLKSNTLTKDKDSNDNNNTSTVSSIGNNTFTSQTKYMLYGQRQKNIAYTVWSVLKAIREEFISQIENKADQNDLGELYEDEIAGILYNKLGLLRYCHCNGKCVSTILYRESNDLDKELREEKEERKMLELKLRGIKVKDNADKKEKEKRLLKNNIKKNIISPGYKETEDGSSAPGYKPLSRCVTFLMLRDTIGSLSSKYLYKSKRKGIDKSNKYNEAEKVHSGLELAKYLGSETQWVGFQDDYSVTEIKPLPPPLVSAILNIPIFSGGSGKVKKRAKGVDATSAALRGETTDKVENDSMILKNTYDYRNIDINSIRSLASCVDFILRMAITLFYNETDSKNITFSDDAVTRINSNIISHGNGTGTSNTSVSISGGSYATSPTFATGGVMGAILIEVARGVADNRGFFRGSEKSGVDSVIEKGKMFDEDMWSLIKGIYKLLVNCANIALRYKLMEKKLNESQDSEIFNIIAYGDPNMRKIPTKDGNVDMIYSMNKSNSHIIQHSLSHISREELLKIERAPDLEKSKSYNDQRLKMNLPIFALMRCVIPLCNLFSVTACSSICGILCDEIININDSMVKCCVEFTNNDNSDNNKDLLEEQQLVDFVYKKMKAVMSIFSLFDMVLSGHILDDNKQKMVNDEEIDDKNEQIQEDYNNKNSCLLSRDLYIAAEAFNLASSIKLNIVESKEVEEVTDEFTSKKLNSKVFNDKKQKLFEKMKKANNNIPLYFTYLKYILSTLVKTKSEYNVKVERIIDTCNEIVKMCRRMTYSIAAAIAMYIPGNASLLLTSSRFEAGSGKFGNKVTRNGIIRGDIGGMALALLCNKNTFSWNTDNKWCPCNMIVPTSTSMLSVRTISLTIIDSICSCIRGLTNDIRVYTALYERVNAIRVGKMVLDQNSREMDLIQESVLMLPTVLASVVDATEFDSGKTDTVGNELNTMITKICIEWAMWDKKIAARKIIETKKQKKQTNRSLMVDSAMKMLTNAIGGKIKDTLKSKSYEMTSFFNPNACMSAITLLDSLLSISVYLGKGREEVIGEEGNNKNVKKDKDRQQLWSYGFLDDDTVSLLILLCVAVYKNSGNVENIECVVKNENKTKDNNNNNNNNDGGKRNTKTIVTINKLRLACCQLLSTVYLSGCTRRSYDAIFEGKKDVVEEKDIQQSLKLSLNNPIIAPLLKIMGRAGEFMSLLSKFLLLDFFSEGNKPKITTQLSYFEKNTGVIDYATSALGLLDGFFSILLSAEKNEIVQANVKSFMSSDKFQNTMNNVLQDTVLVQCVLDRNILLEDNSKKAMKSYSITYDWEFLYRLMSISLHCCGFRQKDDVLKVKDVVNFNPKCKIASTFVQMYNNRLWLKNIDKNKLREFNTINTLLQNKHEWIRTISTNIINEIYSVNATEGKMAVEGEREVFSTQSVVSHLVMSYSSLSNTILDVELFKKMHKNIVSTIWSNFNEFKDVLKDGNFMKKLRISDKDFKTTQLKVNTKECSELELVWLNDFTKEAQTTDILSFVLSRLYLCVETLCKSVNDFDENSFVPFDKNLVPSLQCCIELSLHFLTMPDMEIEVQTQGQTMTLSSKKRVAGFCVYIIRRISMLYDEAKAAKKYITGRVRDVSMVARKALNAVQSVHGEVSSFLRITSKKGPR